MGIHLASVIIFSIGSVICHQRPERSFFWAGHQFPVCARCTGLYLSAALGLIAWVAIKWTHRWQQYAVEPRRARTVFVLVAIPTAMSLLGGMSGVWDGSNAIRALLSVPLGLTAGVIVAAVATKDLR